MAARGVDHAGCGARACIVVPRRIATPDRQETGDIRRIRRPKFTSRYAQPFEEHIGVHRVARRRLHHRNTRRCCVNADPQLPLMPFKAASPGAPPTAL